MLPLLVLLVLDSAAPAAGSGLPCWAGPALAELPSVSIQDGGPVIRICDLVRSNAVANFQADASSPAVSRALCLPGVPKSVLMSLVGLACVSLFHGRRVWLAMLSLAVSPGQQAFGAPWSVLPLHPHGIHRDCLIVGADSMSAMHSKAHAWLAEQGLDGRLLSSVCKEPKCDSFDLCDLPTTGASLSRDLSGEESGLRYAATSLVLLTLALVPRGPPGG